MTQNSKESNSNTQNSKKSNSQKNQTLRQEVRKEPWVPFLSYIPKLHPQHGILSFLIYLLKSGCSSILN